MNDNRTAKPSPDTLADRLARIREWTDEDIQRGIDADPDTVELDEAFFANARLRNPDGTVVERIAVDADISDWLRNDPERKARLVNEHLRKLMKDEAA